MRALALVLAVLCVGCEVAPPVSTHTTNNGVVVTVVAEFDGIRLYHVNRGTGARDVYVARVIGSAAVSAQWTENCGKNCTRDVQLETLVAR